jgi:hypothetical protein
MAVNNQTLALTGVSKVKVGIHCVTPRSIHLGFISALRQRLGGESKILFLKQKEVDLELLSAITSDENKKIAVLGS